MPSDGTKLVTFQSLKDTTIRIKQEYLEAIAKSGYAKFRKVDAVPDPQTAEDNVLYLVKDNSADYYNIYALIDGAMTPFGNTSVDLDGYVTTEELAQAVSEAVSGEVQANIATDEEFNEMIIEVFGPESGTV